jgi:hypothetical protein
MKPHIVYPKADEMPCPIDPAASAGRKLKLFGDQAELTADELAALKGISRRTLDDLERAGKLKAFGGSGCNRRFHLRTNLILQARDAGIEDDVVKLIYPPAIHWLPNRDEFLV